MTIATYIPVRLIGYGVVIVIGGIVTLVIKAMSAVKTVEPTAFVPELSRIRRTFTPALAEPVGALARVVPTIEGAAIERITDTALFVNLRLGGGVFVRITPTSAEGATTLLVEGARKVKVDGLAKAEDAMLAFESALRRQLASAGFTVTTAPPVAAPAPTAAPPPAPPSPSVAPEAPLPAPRTRSLVLCFDDGTSRRIETACAVVGRAPSTRVDDAGASLVAIDDTTMSVSKTHFAVGIDDDGVWVQDRSSTNGVMIRRDGDEVVAVPERIVRVSADSTIGFGDRSVTIVVGP